MILLGIDHVALAGPYGCEHVARAFYGGVLGLTEIPQHDNLATAGGLSFRGRSVAVDITIEHPFSPAKKAHAGFVVTDLKALQTRLKEIGLPVSPGADIGRQRIFTEDPFGNRLEFFQDGDGFSQRT